MNGRELLYDWLPSKNRGGNMNRESHIDASHSRDEARPIKSRRLVFFFAAARSLVRNPIRSGTVILSLVAIISPLVVATAISEGMKTQYSAVLREGADAYVTRDNFGSNAPIELSAADRFKEIPGIIKVVPRIVGRTYGEGKFVAVLGIDSAEIPRAIQVIQGRMPAAKGEVILGWRVAERLNVRLGSQFSLQRNPGQVFSIAGLFATPFTIWESDLMVMSLEDAADLFAMQGKATDLLIYTRPGYEQIVDPHHTGFGQGATRQDEPPRCEFKPGNLSVATRSGVSISRQGFSQVSIVSCLAWAFPASDSISGFGLAERRREIGVLKAFGWQTRDVLEMVALENLVLGLLSVPLIVIVSGVWIHLFNGEGIARYFWRI